MLTSYEPGEDWFFDDRTGALFAGPQLATPRHHPASQSVPGPADRVPTDWTERLH